MNDDYQDISIVYALINPNDSVSYIRIEKAYLTDGNIYQAAQIPDSNLFPYKLDVKMYSNNRTILFDTITIYNKDTGIFYAPKMKVYYAVTKNRLNTDDIYHLEINNPKTGDQLTSSTSLVDGSRIRYSYPRSKADFSNDKACEFKSISNVTVYQLNIRFHYTEGYLSGGDTIFSEHYVDWIQPSVHPINNSAGQEISIPYSGEAFYSNLENNIPYKENVFRYVGQAEFITSSADETFNAYMEINKPSASLVIDRPLFTNIENGYGIFASRSKYNYSYDLTGPSIIKLRRIESLNFVQRPH